jgi:peptidoglycan/LPS O-acetylase OafA/YrhL
MSFGIAWTLVYEVLFYLLFSLLILNKQFGTMAFLVWGCLVLAYPYFETHPWRFLFSHHHISFLAGMCTWAILRRWKIPLPRLVAVAGAIMFLASGLFADFYGPLTAGTQILCFTLSSAITILGLVEAERSGLIRTPGSLIYLGNASFAIYLVHFPVLSLTAKITKALQLDFYLPIMALFFIHVVVAVVAGCLCYRFIDNPVHQWSRRFFRRVRTPVVEVKLVNDTVRTAA